jgi:hypothetical protein
MTPVRASAVLAMLLSAGAIFGVSTTSAFGFQRLDIAGAALTPIERILASAGIELGTNLVGLATEPIAERVRVITSVRDVSVSVFLPDTLRLTVAERRPIVVWQVGADRYAVDEGGLLFATLGPDERDIVDGVPTVVDERAATSSLGVRSVLDPVILDAATRIGSLTPSQIGSHAPALSVHITDTNGFTVSSGDDGWLAIFGAYGQSQRTPAMIPGQVQALTAVLAKGEDRMERIILADDRAGTYTLKPTPEPSAKPSTAP